MENRFVVVRALGLWEGGAEGATTKEQHEGPCHEGMLCILMVPISVSWL